MDAANEFCMHQLAVVLYRGVPLTLLLSIHKFHDVTFWNVSVDFVILQ